MKIGKVGREVFSSVIQQRLGKENKRVIVPRQLGSMRE